MAVLGLAPLGERAGHVGPVLAPAFDGDDRAGVDTAGDADGDTGIAQGAGDADPVEVDTDAAEAAVVGGSRCRRDHERHARARQRSAIGKPVRDHRVVRVVRLFRGGFRHELVPGRVPEDARNG
jgi:hypothetical protein